MLWFYFGVCYFFNFIVLRGTCGLNLYMNSLEITEQIILQQVLCILNSFFFRFLA